MAISAVDSHTAPQIVSYTLLDAKYEVSDSEAESGELYIAPMVKVVAGGEGWWQGWGGGWGRWVGALASADSFLCFVGAAARCVHAAWRLACGSRVVAGVRVAHSSGVRLPL